MGGPLSTVKQYILSGGELPFRRGGRKIGKNGKNSNLILEEKN